MSIWTTLEMAKKQVGIPLDETAFDDQLLRLLTQAESQCLDYVVNYSGDQTPEPPNSVPQTPSELRTALRVQGAIYLQFGELWRFRGDDVDGEAPQSRLPGSLAPQVERAILSMRVPSFG